MKSQVLLKAVSLYLVYFVYTYFTGFIIQQFNGFNEYSIRMIMDAIFLALMVIVYRKSLKVAWNNLKKNYSKGKIIKIVILGFLAIIVMNFVIGMISDLIFPNMTIDENTQAIESMASLSAIYTIFKTMIFGVIAEELLFRESLSLSIKNNIILVLITSVICTLMNFVFSTSSGDVVIVQMLAYFSSAIVFSMIYVKNNRNILLVMLVKFFYNLIPLALLFIA